MPFLNIDGRGLTLHMLGGTAHWTRITALLRLLVSPEAIELSPLPTPPLESQHK